MMFTYLGAFPILIENGEHKESICRCIYISISPPNHLQSLLAYLAGEVRQWRGIFSLTLKGGE
jgi:hypothetical protein